MGWSIFLIQIHVRFIVIFLTNFPDNKIPWAPWMASAVHSHGPHMGCHYWGPWGLATSCHVGHACLPLLMSMSVPHRAPDSKIPWTSWMANEGHSHGPHMGCQWWGPWGLATRCHMGPTYLALLIPIWASMGPMCVCHHSASKIPWAHEGPTCLALETPTSQVIARVTPNGVQWQGQYAETGSCKYLCHAKVT